MILSSIIDFDVDKMVEVLRDLGCDFFGSVMRYTHIRVRRFAKFFPSHAKVSYAKVFYLRMCYVKW